MKFSEDVALDFGMQLGVKISQSLFGPFPPPSDRNWQLALRIVGGAAAALTRPRNDSAPLNDLFGVGPDKPLGYLPVDVITTPGMLTKYGCEIGAIRALCEGAGNVTVLHPGGYCDNLYVWNRPALSGLLRRENKILTKARWPTDPKRFVDKVAKRTISAEENGALYRLIGMAFADKRFPELRCPLDGKPLVGTGKSVRPALGPAARQGRRHIYRCKCGAEIGCAITINGAVEHFFKPNRVVRVRNVRPDPRGSDFVVVK